MTDPDWNWEDTLNGSQNFKNKNNKEQNYYQPNNSSNLEFSQPNYFIPSSPINNSQQWNQIPNPMPTGPFQDSIINNATQFTHNDFGFNGQLNPQYNNLPSATPQFSLQQQPGFNVFPQQITSDPFFNTARHLGGQFAEIQKEKFTKYLSSFRIKYYFAVNTNYVGKKLSIILFPFIHRDWTNKFSEDGQPLSAKDDLNAPDLYIPVMAFITYVIVSGFVFGLQKRFSPEKLGMLTTNALFYLIFENVLVFITKYVLNISQSLNVWHALSYSSYKFVGMVFCLLFYLVGGNSIYYSGLAYFIFATVFFLLRSLKTFILDMGYSSDGGRKRKLYLLLSITILQSLIMWLLTSSVTSYMPEKYDIAKLAIGFAKIGSKNVFQQAQLPLQPDGEVDYEALLKMS